MIYFGLGVLLLVVALWLVRAFVEADAAKLARSTSWFILALGGAAAVAIVVELALSGRLVPVLVGVGGLSPILMRAWQRRRAAQGPPPGRASEVETDFLRMHLDHDSGTMTGTVRRGAFQGRGLADMSRDELLALWRECRADDEQASKLLEAYLDRQMPDWREAARARGPEGEEASNAGRAADAMTQQEAYDILGLSSGASEAEIREAHHRLMMKLHPDHGGSSYLAAKLNRAREVLLKG